MPSLLCFKCGECVGSFVDPLTVELVVRTLPWYRGTTMTDPVETPVGFTRVDKPKEPFYVSGLMLNKLEAQLSCEDFTGMWTELHSFCNDLSHFPDYVVDMKVIGILDSTASNFDRYVGEEIAVANIYSDSHETFVAKKPLIFKLKLRTQGFNFGMRTVSFHPCYAYNSRRRRIYRYSKFKHVLHNKYFTKDLAILTSSELRSKSGLVTAAMKYEV